MVELFTRNERLRGSIPSISSKTPLCTQSTAEFFGSNYVNLDNIQFIYSSLYLKVNNMLFPFESSFPKFHFQLLHNLCLQQYILVIDLDKSVKMFFDEPTSMSEK